MLNVSLAADHTRLCSGATRRDMLKVGTLGALGIGLPQLLKSEAVASHSSKGAPRAKSVILVFLGGGLSHHDSFDLKPDAPAEIRGEYKPISTSVPGLQIGEKLPLMAKCMDKLTLIRSGSHNNDHHETATNWVLSGRFGSAFGDYPAMGAVVAHEVGFRTTLPPYMSIPRNPSFTWELGKSAYLGGRYESFKTGDPAANGFRVQDTAPSESLTAERTNRRQSLLAAVDDLARKIDGNDQIATYDEFQQRASSLILSSEARRAFAIEQESEAVRNRYGRNTFGQSCLLGRRLIESGVRFVTVNYGGWDHHGKIFDGLKHKLPEFDLGFSALIEDLNARGLLQDTLVVAMGEFGRTPKINKDAGRDHWGGAASLLFAGAGVKSGHVIGSTDKQGAFPTRRPVAPADVSYTILESLGIDPRKMLTTPDGRPIEILDQGETVHELFA
ncbi:DUF1501 domain-containing protein [Tuwongella immobilis]|uniref:DUF1501 domain-containing protein n=1 Tax=Tuwongella immobilis TaxID=692036 RepID=A0A6C2YV28_9BACT|nr:DUF1501 domain-containing protein [Tuwongella immobilis]VIP05251.1 sulfatase : Uncharacterized protein OS=Pirellula staleyi (strain ATCC 27377 / DSM 6068 / ICPB 4128) GN=Psta_4130 PE=4 SV=1: DUF1501 [Tuwongella immobilis]VTS07858.1 sulfatase : Uncharacterized protein OS=Pirellula staleyi (strain ATCC 27377 / DSM 6068 / ICPB 4128) GN=Psta_4130 PE=4 SV=1: DUF1501 [Tuwongella immobilis]